MNHNEQNNQSVTSLTRLDKIVLRYVKKQKQDRNTIRNSIFNRHLEKTLFDSYQFPSKEKVDYVLKKLVKHRLIETEKWHMRNMRVYFKPQRTLRRKC